MDNDYTRIVVILDRSGSMSSVQDATISSFNEFVGSQKDLPGKAKLKLVQFDNQYEVSFDNWIKEVPKLDRSTFVPRGMTALLDAQGRTISELGQELAATPENERPSKVMVVILTDGEENISKEYKLETIANMIKEQQDKYGWNFVFLAANQDAVKTAAKFNIRPQSAMTFNTSDAGLAGATYALNNYTKSFRSYDGDGGEATKNVSFSDEERSGSMSK